MSGADPKNLRYLKNRSLWRKTTPYARQKPQPVTLLDLKTNKVYSFDKTRILRDRDPYEIEDNDGYSSSFVFAQGEYQEELITFTNENLKNVSFPVAFSNAPYVVLSFDSPTTENNIGISVGYVDTTDLIILTTVNFTGTIRYRAFYAASYPAQVTDTLDNTIVILGGRLASTGDGTIGQSHFEETINAGQPFNPTSTYVTPVFVSNPFADPIDSNVSIVQSEIVPAGNNVTVSYDVSAPLTTFTSIDYLLVL